MRHKKPLSIIQTLDITGLESGDLTAICPSHVEPRKGMCWNCTCSGKSAGKNGCQGKGTRKVLAKDLKLKRVKKCEQCVDPKRRHLQQTNASKRWTKKPDWFSNEFRRNWKRLLEQFTPQQRMLFDIIMDGRTNWQLQMQAVNTVIREGDNIAVIAAIEISINDNPLRFQRYLTRRKAQQQDQQAVA